MIARARLKSPTPKATKAHKLEPEERPDDTRDAARWRALFNCPGLRVMTEVVQPHDMWRKEEGYRYLQLAAATHGIGGRMSKPALREFVDYLVKHGKTREVAE
jgi:hypothetical protein